jgi:glycosyltransferase involved in cell wall biosynthesis
MLISICIPTYHSGEKLDRLLDSIKIQSFKDYEIVISDDSKDDSVKRIITEKYNSFEIRYFHNEIPLGTPDNWNHAIAQAKGNWIKIMHHDDWFRDENSLQKFADVAARKPETSLIFCAFQNVYLDKGSTKEFFCSRYEILLLRLSRLNLFKTFMGNPSCTLINSNCRPYTYDKRFKWLIDFDFYTEFLKKNKRFVYINEAIMNIGMHSNQVTAFVFKNPVVEVPESISILEKHGKSVLQNIYVYDFFWRMYRNINVIDIKRFEQLLGRPCPFKEIKVMLAHQSGIGIKLLKNGIISKLFMVLSFVKNYFLK